MLNNNISNRKAPSILIRIDNFLIKPKKDKLKDRVLNKVFGDTTVVEVDKYINALIRTTFRTTDYAIGLVVLEEEWLKYNTKTINKILELPIGDIHVVKNTKGIASLLFSNEYMYCVDNEESFSLIGHPNCITKQEFHQLIKGGYTFE